ncbi:MAG: MoaD/ThiS family protein [Actinomycetota bacterium]|nr:MoaD/ThiS family protein [Actinomycetota bacterium]
MAVVRLFAAAREAAGVGSDELPGKTVDDVLAEARGRYGETFATVLTTCRVWLNGDETSGGAPVDDGDEIAVLPPVSGGT